MRFAWRSVRLLMGLILVTGQLRADEFPDEGDVQRLPAVDELAAPAWLKPAGAPFLSDGESDGADSGGFF